MDAAGAEAEAASSCINSEICFSRGPKGPIGWRGEGKSGSRGRMVKGWLLDRGPD